MKESFQKKSNMEIISLKSFRDMMGFDFPPTEETPGWERENHKRTGNKIGSLPVRPSFLVRYMPFGNDASGQFSEIMFNEHDRSFMLTVCAATETYPEFAAFWEADIRDMLPQTSVPFIMISGKLDSAGRDIAITLLQDPADGLCDTTKDRSAPVLVRIGEAVRNGRLFTVSEVGLDPHSDTRLEDAPPGPAGTD